MKLLKKNLSKTQPFFAIAENLKSLKTTSGVVCSTPLPASRCVFISEIPFRRGKSLHMESDATEQICSLTAGEMVSEKTSIILTSPCTGDMSEFSTRVLQNLSQKVEFLAKVQNQRHCRHRKANCDLRQLFVNLCSLSRASNTNAFTF